MIFYDTHTHLYLKEFDQDRADAIERAVASGVEKFFLPNIDNTSIESMMQMEKDFAGKCFPMIGLHPCSVNNNYKEELNTVEDWLQKHTFYGIGEVGIDLYWDKTFVENQKKAFRHQVRLAKKYNLPVIIHLRDAFDETFQIVTEENDSSLKGIFHCFAGTVEQADKVIGLGGFKLGIGGVATFKNSGLDKVLSEVDLKHIVLETDSPYLAPVPYRGKRNESSYIPLIAQKLAEIYNVSVEEIARITTENAKEIFNIQ
jgi:TatD DNase family protein